MVKEEGEHEEGAEDEQRRGRVVDPEQRGDHVEPASPEREDEHDGGGEEPEERVALAQPPSANELEHDGEKDERGDRRGDRDPQGGHRSCTGRGVNRKSPTKTASRTLTV